MCKQSCGRRAACHNKGPKFQSPCPCPQHDPTLTSASLFRHPLSRPLPSIGLQPCPTPISWMGKLRYRGTGTVAGHQQEQMFMGPLPPSSGAMLPAALAVTCTALGYGCSLRGSKVAVLIHCSLVAKCATGYGHRAHLFAAYGVSEFTPPGEDRQMGQVSCPEVQGLWAPPWPQAELFATCWLFPWPVSSLSLTCHVCKTGERLALLLWDRV